MFQMTLKQNLYMNIFWAITLIKRHAACGIWHECPQNYYESRIFRDRLH